MITNTVEIFSQKLKEKRLTIVCAESITAGLLASTIASISGASDILKGSIVTYSRELKTSILNVDPRIIDFNTAESIETTIEMTYGLTKIYPSADIFVAVTGVASESTNGYKLDKEVGQIYIAVYHKNKMNILSKIIDQNDIKRVGDIAKQNNVEKTERNIIRELTVESIFDFILSVI
ncbi:PncC family amidohydrolase [Flavobacterium sp. 2755]|uniref:CinA family protein n=1 Tax=Flavobacterium sp. 2755 TaxID=2817765 RepID=UPI00285E3DA9|nr:CinA family protein [Flavobacterium sp. 2755]MDR6761625.1 PncC family amidohydrolase [Flavobacterium sp. 2755]